MSQNTSSSHWMVYGVQDGSANRMQTRDSQYSKNNIKQAKPCHNDRSRTGHTQTQNELTTACTNNKPTLHSTRRHLQKRSDKLNCPPTFVRKKAAMQITIWTPCSSELNSNSINQTDELTACANKESATTLMTNAQN
jgi:hypothetical protein